MIREIENPWVTGPYPGDDEPPVAAECANCKCDLHAGETAIKIGSDYYCTDCAEECELEAPEEDCEPERDIFYNNF